MPLFIIFILGAVIIGTGALLSPAWPTNQPRVGLAAALALALVMGGAIFLASLFGWDTLSVDYLLFALVTTIFLGGTLTFGQKRAEERGIALEDFDEGWTSARDLGLLVLAAAIMIAPLLLLPVPMDTDAQGFGYLSLMIKLGGGYRSLTPFYPNVEYLYAPGFPTLVAYLSQQLDQGLHVVMFSIAAVLGFILVWLAYDFGSEWQDKRLGRAMAIATLFSGGLLTTYLDSHFTTMLALVFVFAFLIYVMRYTREGKTGDAVAAALLLGAVVLAHPDTTIILMLGYVPWLATVWFSANRPTMRQWLVLVIAIPLGALLAISPWLWSIRDLFGENIVSPFVRDPSYWQVMLLYNGVWIYPFAIIGAVVGVRARNSAAILSVGWLILALDFAAIGIIDTLFGWIPIFRYDYPFSIAWHAPIIPLSILGGMGILWVWDRVAKPDWDAKLHQYAYPLIGTVLVIVLAVAVFNQDLLDASKGRVQFYGAFSSHADVQAMTWLKDNTPPETRILNYPAPHEAEWAAVITERDAIYFRPQPFYHGEDAPLPDKPSAEQARLMAFWADPADPDHLDLLRDSDITYVIVPQVVGNPESFATLYRWREPFSVESQSQVSDAPYLEEVYSVNGAAVYRVTDAD